MTPKRTRAAKNIAISLLGIALAMIFSAVAFAGTEVGRVTHLSGPLFAKKADGTTKVLSVQSVVEEGDTLLSEKKSYARIKFTDGSEINMRPGSQLKVSEYSFDQYKPKEDRIVMNLLAGGMRAITGMIGKRGNQDGYQVVTDTAVAGVRGTTYECKLCQGNCGTTPNGLYLFVLDGIVHVKNEAGSQNVNAGQYLYVRTSTSAPQILPGNPGIDFTLPATITDSSKGKDTTKNDPGCIVR